MKLKVSDVVVRTRDVEIPDDCPKCGVALKIELDGGDSPTLVPVTLEWNFTGGVLLDVTLADGLPVPPAGFTCECGHVLVWGCLQVINTPPREVERATLWSRSVDRLIFKAQP